ncbi:MAG: DNA polymerase domain-containing protein, partial [Candidatus Woesearchaeota archaeon]
MRAYLLDAYRLKNSIVLWLKSPESDLRIEKGFNTFIYLEASEKSGNFLKKNKIQYIPLEKQNYLRQWKKVFAVKVPVLSEFEKFVNWIEESTRHRVRMYNADILPEQLFLYENNLVPCSSVEINKRIVQVSNDTIALKKAFVSVVPSSRDGPVRCVRFNGRLLEGDEMSVLESFVREFSSFDPDVVVMDYAFSRLPYLVQRLEIHKLVCPFHRFDHAPIKYKGGKSFYSYGRVHYRDFAIRLHGRFLVDASTTIGHECDVDAIIELCQLSGSLFQQAASRSYGAVFQTALVRQMVQHGFLVPFKEKPVDKPLTMLELLKSDRAGHTFDPKIGFHNDVAEVDFCSMYPWLIYNHNISADTILSDFGPFDSVPGIPVKASLRHKGLVPIAIKPILDRRMYYKKHPTAVNKARSKGLKMVLVTCYGYLRFREFKMGVPTSHMAICAYAREILVAAASLAEQHGFEVVHGIIDSLYIKKKGIKESDVRDFCKELELMTGIPVSFEGIFRWLVFLPSINDSKRPVPARYFGVFNNGKIKVRGIELRQSGVPLVVRAFQQRCLEVMGQHSKKEIESIASTLCISLRELVKKLPSMSADLLKCSVVIGKVDYKHNISQKIILRRLREKDI